VLFPSSERRTKVIDDESDYFTVNSVWLSKAEREKLQQREEELQARHHASRLNRRLTLDFAGSLLVLCCVFPHTPVLCLFLEIFATSVLNLQVVRFG
jgi:hypothetical protein